MDPIDKTFAYLAVFLILISLFIYFFLPNKGLFWFLFVSMCLLIFFLMFLVMAGLALWLYRKEKSIKFSGRHNFWDMFFHLGPAGRDAVLAIIWFLIIFLFVLNVLMYYRPF